MFSFGVSRSARIRLLVRGGAFRPTPSLSLTGSRGLAFVERGKINPTGRTRSLMSRPATQQPWRTFKVFFSDGADGVDDPPGTSPPQETHKVDFFPKPPPSPETGGNEIDQPPKASFQKAGRAGEEGQGQNANSTKEESGPSSGSGVATNKKHDLLDRILVLEIFMNEKLTNVKGHLKDMRSDLQAGRNETYLIIKIFLWGIVAVCGTVVGEVLFKLLYLDTRDKRQARADLEEAMTITEEHLGKQIGNLRSEVHQVRDEIKLLYWEVKSIHGEMKGVFQTLRSR